MLRNKYLDIDRHAIQCRKLFVIRSFHHNKKYDTKIGHRLRNNTTLHTHVTPTSIVCFKWLTITTLKEKKKKRKSLETNHVSRCEMDVINECKV